MPALARPQSQLDPFAPSVSPTPAGPAADPTAEREQQILARAQAIKEQPYKPPTGAQQNQIEYSPNGIPRTDEAWAMQSAIDGGKLLRLYDRLKASGGFRSDDPQLEQATIDGYLAEAGKKGKDAAFMGEFLPTDTGHMGDALKNAGKHLATGQEEQRGLQGSAGVGMIRLGNMQVAEAYERQHPDQELYSLLVPYSNTVENILNNDAKPKDGAEKLTEYLGKLHSRDVTTLATGYSQGGAAVLEYEAEHPHNDQGLDYSVALAPMGGANQRGEAGVWSGQRDGVATMSVAHTLDPARGLYSQNGKGDIADPLSGQTLPGGQKLPELPGVNPSLLGHAVNFTTSPNGFLHGKPFADDAKKGTYGYNTNELRPELDQFFQRGPEQASFAKRRDWDSLPKADEIPKDAQGRPLYRADPTQAGDAMPSWKSVEPVLHNAIEQKGEQLQSGVERAWDGAKQLEQTAVHDSERVGQKLKGWGGRAWEGAKHLEQSALEKLGVQHEK